MGIKLYEHQVNYLLDKGNLKVGRRTGKTVAYCIKLALSEGNPLNMKTPDEFSDYGDGSVRYARDFFRGEFLMIRDKLRHYGFPVRDIKC